MESPTKIMTKGDEFYTRTLSNIPKETDIQFKLYLSCSGLPKATLEDEALWKRVRVILF